MDTKIVREISVFAASDSVCAIVNKSLPRSPTMRAKLALTNAIEQEVPASNKRCKMKKKTCVYFKMRAKDNISLLLNLLR